MSSTRSIRRRYHVGPPFLLYVALILLVAMAAANGGSNLLIWIFGVLTAALLVSGFVSGGTIMRLRVRRLHPGHGLVGEPLVVQYAVTNRGRALPAFNIHLEERPVEGAGDWRMLMNHAPAWVMHAGPRQTVHGEATFWPHRRGEARFGELRLKTSFPFGLIMKSATRRQPQRVLIYPRLFTLRTGVLNAIAPPAAMGTRMTPYAGSGSDYYGLREFRPGDSMRNISWKRTANRDSLVSIERTRPAPPRLRIVLNLTQPTEAIPRSDDGPDPRDLEERAISLAASFVHVADLAGYETGLTILGTDQSPVPVRRSHWHRNRLMALLAAIDLDEPRRAPAPEERPTPDRAAILAIHPDRVDADVIGGDAWHLTAHQLEHLVVASSSPAPRGADGGPRRDRAAEAAA
ncbi:MAG: DUF58 domain-containing protein [Planctomycetes bacterium]|nr:DUF58 domain-containing protein [Planctomycetota bacterium]